MLFLCLFVFVFVSKFVFGFCLVVSYPVLCFRVVSCLIMSFLRCLVVSLRCVVLS
jgi:hypothetical protein